MKMAAKKRRYGLATIFLYCGVKCRNCLSLMSVFVVFEHEDILADYIIEMACKDLA
jgi:hypothetical protein